MYSGRRGVITIEEKKGIKIATKSAKDSSKKGAINKERKILEYLQDKNISFVPKVIDYDDGWFTYKRIEGEHVKQDYKKKNKQGKRELVLDLLKRAYELDKVGVVHGEFIRPFTNMLVSPSGSISVIDFERGTLGDTSGKNMRSYAQRLLAEGRISLSETKHIGKMTREEIYTFLAGKLEIETQDKKYENQKQQPTTISKGKISFLFSLLLSLIFLDQVTKYLFYNLQRGESSQFISPILNTGIGRSIPVPLPIVLVLTVCICLALLRYRKNKHIDTTSTLLILAGAGGNFIDRVLFAGVRDFIDLSYWPIFNLADVYLTLAFISIVYFHFFLFTE